jgi:hypothetical protein
MAPNCFEKVNRYLNTKGGQDTPGAIMPRDAMSNWLKNSEAHIAPKEQQSKTGGAPVFRTLPSFTRSLRQLPELFRDGWKRARGKMPEDDDYQYVKQNLASFVRFVLEEVSGKDIQTGQPLTVKPLEHLLGAGYGRPVRYARDLWKKYWADGEWDAAYMEVLQRRLHNEGVTGSKLYEGKPDTFKAKKTQERMKQREAGEKAFGKRYR